MFVYTNGSMAADGLHSEIYSGTGKMFIPEIIGSENFKHTVVKLFQQYNRNTKYFIRYFAYYYSDLKWIF